jgi:hypothetical protein
LLELIKVRAGDTVHTFSVYKNGVFELEPEAESKLRADYLTEKAKEIPAIGPFTLPDFLDYAKNHKILKKFSWESYFGKQLN